MISLAALLRLGRLVQGIVPLEMAACMVDIKVLSDGIVVIGNINGDVVIYDGKMLVGSSDDESILIVKLDVATAGVGENMLASVIMLVL